MATTWEPPEDPDFAALASACGAAWERDKPRLIAFDTETTGLEFNDTAFCVSVAWPGPEGDEAHYIELAGFSFLAEKILKHAKWWVGHNIKFDILKVINAGLVDRSEVPNIQDTEALAHLDDEHRPKGLKPLAVSVLGYNDTIEVEYKSGKRKGEKYEVPREKWEIENARKWAKKKYGLASVKDVGYHLLPRGTVVPYAIKDAEWTLQLYRLLSPKVRQYEDLTALYKQEMELTRTFIDMESAGMRVDPEYVNAKVKEYARRILEHHWKIGAIVGKEVRTGKIPPKQRKNYFNPSSSAPDVGDYLAQAGYERDSYDAANLSEIDHPLAKAVLALRDDEKVYSTYLRPIQKEQVDSIVHPNIRQHGTVTGRVSSGKETG